MEYLLKGLALKEYMIPLVTTILSDIWSPIQSIVNYSFSLNSACDLINQQIIGPFIQQQLNNFFLSYLFNKVVTSTLVFCIMVFYCWFMLSMF